MLRQHLLLVHPSGPPPFVGVREAGGDEKCNV